MRQHIIDVTESLLIEGGSSALTLEAVSSRADVAVQTIYNRVGGRSALLIAIAERALQRNRDYMDAAYASPGTPVERILRAGDAYGRFATECPHAFRLLADPPSDEPEALEQVAKLVIEQNAKLAAAIRDGIKDGSLDSELDPDLTATALWAMINGIYALNWRTDLLRPSPAEFKQLRKTTARLMHLGLRKREVGQDELKLGPGL